MFVNACALIERTVDGEVEILIQKRNKPDEVQTCLELPGGRVEEYESIIEALRREVREETGLEVTEILGEDTKIDVKTYRSNVECFKPFAVYQTTQGPVDSMGVYFRCKAEGELLEAGDGTEQIRWVKAETLAEWIAEDRDQFSWVDLSGLTFYLQTIDVMTGES